MEQKLHTPEGVRDIYSRECEIKLTLQKKLNQVLHLYGYRDIQTPTFEYYDVFREEIGSTSTQELYKFFDREGNILALRPDITPSVARAAATLFDTEDFPLRFCYVGNTFINHTSYRGKLKENTQFGAELIGLDSVEADAEMIAMVADALKKTGLEEFQISIGHVDFLQSILSAAELDEETVERIRELIGNRMDNNQVENKCQRILPEIRSVHPDQNAHRNQKQINIVDDRGKSRHTVLPAQCVLQHKRGIVCNGFAQPLKGIGGLIKCFDLRHTTYIFHRSAVHVLLSGLKTVHFFLCFSVEARKLHDKGQNNTDQTNHAIPPVNSKKNDNQNKRRDQRGHKVRELVSDEFLNTFNVFI